MKFLMACLFSLLSLPVFAVFPQEGLYFNPDASGRGVAFEIREDTVVATFFGYGVGGEAQWWQGVMTETSDDVWEGGFDAFKNGQCFNCSYTAPDIDSSNGIGNVKIELLAPEKMRFTWPGGSDVLVKQNWGYFSDLDHAYGLWAMSGYDGDLKAQVSHSVVFWGETGSGNERVIMGNVAGYQGTSNRIAVATDSGEGANDGVIYMLVDISATRNVLYKLNTTKTTLSGAAVLLDSNDNPIASYTGVGKRVFSGYGLGVGANGNNAKSAIGIPLNKILGEDALDAYRNLSQRLREFDNM